MNYYRSLVYSFINKTAREARQEISRIPKDHQHYQAVEGGSDEDLYLHGLLNGVEEERVHVEAGKLRKRGEELKARGLSNSPGERSLAMSMGAALIVEAIAMDPYEERDGQVFRKSDGAFIRNVKEKKDDQ